MNRAKRIIRSPVALTAVLSAATIAGYVAYRFTLGTDDSAETSLAAIDEEQYTTPPLPDALPELVLDDLAGTPTALSSFAGKPLLINFWATWCGPCREEIPMLKTFHDERQDIEVIGIAVDDLAPVHEFAEEIQFNYPVLVGQSDAFEAMSTFQNISGGMPFSVYVAADGAILGNKAAKLDPEDLANFVATTEALADGRIDRAGARDMIAGFR